MAKHTYKILEGAPLDHPLLQGSEVDQEIELDLSAEQRRALVAAGWVSEPLDAEPAPGKSKGGKA